MASDIAIAARRHKPNFLIDICTGDTIRLGTTNVILSSRFYIGSILEISEIGSTFNWQSFTYSPNSVSVTAVNLPIFYGKRLSDIEKFLSIENAECKIYIWFPDLSYSDIQTNGLIFRGLYKKEAQTTNINILKFTIKPYGASAWKTLSENSINVGIFGSGGPAGTWPDHRTSGGDGSVSGNAYPLVFGTHSDGLKMDCVDTTAYKYIVSGGQPMESVDSITDKDGTAISSGWTASNELDGRGNVCTIVDFSADRTSDEPITAGGDGVVDYGGNYTGTADTIIENPTHIFHFLVDNYSSIGPSWADKESIKTAYTLLQHVTMAATCMEITNAGYWIDRILYQCCLLKAERRGKIGIVTLNLNKNATLSFDIKNSSVGTLQIEKTDKDLVVNDLSVQYGYHPSKKSYAGELLLSWDKYKICKDSYRLYGAMPKVNLQLPDISKESDAGILAKRYLDFFAFRNDIITELDFTYDDGWDFRRGDCAEVTISNAPSDDSSGWVNKKCLLIEKFYLNNVIRTTWLKIRDELQ